MSSEKSLEDLFNEAIERNDPVERARFLDEACGENGELREQVEQLVHEPEKGHHREGSPRGRRKLAGADSVRNLYKSRLA